MTILKHALFAAVYILLALTLALLLPGMVPGVAGPTAWIAAAVALLAGMFVHEVFNRNAREQEILNRLSLYAQAYERLQSDVIRVQNEVKACRSALAETATEPEPSAALETVMSEVRILQNLVEKVSDRAPVGAIPRPTRETHTPHLAAPHSASPHLVAPTPVADLGEAEILDAVREALRRDQVDLYLQPIVSLPQRKVRYYECFSRIRAGGDSLILPEQFLGLTAREGLLGAIDNILLFRCVQLVRRAQKRRHNVGFFCNISAHTLGDKAFFADFSDFIAANAELASTYGPLTVQGEYSRVAVHRLGDRPTATFSGMYASASWFLTGEHRPYEMAEGEFGRVVPKRSSGAWELAARVSTLDLNDTTTGVDIKGGKGTNVTVGLNWHMNANFKWMLNYVRVMNDENAKPDLVIGTPVAGDDFNILQTRFSLAF